MKVLSRTMPGQLFTEVGAIVGSGEEGQVEWNRALASSVLGNSRLAGV